MKLEITDEREITSLYRCLNLLKDHVLKSLGAPPVIEKIIHEIETNHPDIMDREVEDFGR